jgi:glycosyltransferase involved in cell wall biosynthesis
MELNVLQQADLLITVSRDVKRIFAQKLPAGEASKISVIPNGYDESDFLQKVETSHEKFIMTYTGTISEAYDMTGFLNALDLFGEEKRKKLMLRFVGKIPVPVIDRIRQKLPDLELDLAGYVDHHQSVRYLLQSSLQLLIIPRVENNKGIVTGKFFEYMASGRPVLAIGPHEGDLENIIRETGCGKLFEYDEQDRMLAYLDELMAGNFACSEPEKTAMYSRKALTGKLMKVLLHG